MIRPKYVLNATRCALAISRRCAATVRRSFMYVPSDHESKLKKIPSISPDCAVIDLEDGVGMQSKEQARKNVRRLLTGELPLEFGATEFALRINPVSTDKALYEADMSTLFSSGMKRFPNMIVLPKMEDADQVSFYYEELSKRINEHRAALTAIRKQSSGPIELAFLIESPQAVIGLRELLLHATTHKQVQNSTLKPTCIVFGADDFASAMQIERSDEDILNSELAYSRQKIATCARAFGLDAIDLVLIDFRNESRLAESSRFAARVGFTGKQIVHPAQIRVVNEAFAPAAQRVDWAKRLLSAWNEHASRGSGVFVFEGKMIDMPTVRIAENLTARHLIISERERQKRTV